MKSKILEDLNKRLESLEAHKKEIEERIQTLIKETENN